MQSTNVFEMRYTKEGISLEAAKFIKFLHGYAPE